MIEFLIIELFIVMAYIIFVLYLTLFPRWANIQYLFSWGRFSKEEKQINKDFIDYLTNGEDFTKFQSERARGILGHLAQRPDYLRSIRHLDFDFIVACRKTWEWEKGIGYITAKYQRWENND